MAQTPAATAVSASARRAELLNDLLMQRNKMQSSIKRPGHYWGPDYVTLD